MNKYYIAVRAYLNENLGDDLFLHILCNRYPQFLFYIFKPSYRKKDFYPKNVVCVITPILHFCRAIDRKFQKILRMINGKTVTETVIERYMRKKELEMYFNARENIFIIGSGFIETENFDQEAYLNELRYFREKPYVLGCNFGPFSTNSFLSAYKKLFGLAKDVCFRDTYSKALFTELTNVRSEMDIVFTYNLGEKKILPDTFQEYVLISVVNLNKDCVDNKLLELDYIKFIVECVSHFLGDNKKVVFLGFCKNQGDDKVIEKIMSFFKDRNEIMVYNYPDIDYKEAIGLFAGASEIITSRYHAMILAMLYRKKSYIISYSDKITHVLQDIDPNAPYIEVKKISKINSKDFLENYGYKISEKKVLEMKDSAERQFKKLDKILLFNK